MRRTGARGDRQVEGSCRHRCPVCSCGWRRRMRRTGSRSSVLRERQRSRSGNWRSSARRLTNRLGSRSTGSTTGGDGHSCSWQDSGSHRPRAPRPARVHRARRLVRRLLRARNAGCTRSASSGVVPVLTPLPDPTGTGRRRGRRRVSSPENDRDRRCDVRARAEREARDAVRAPPTVSYAGQPLQPAWSLGGHIPEGPASWPATPPPPTSSRPRPGIA